MRILVACRKFDKVVGGVERMSTTLMNEMVARGHDVSLFTWDDNEDAQAFYPMDAKISWYKMALGNPAQKAGIGLMLKRALKVRRILKALRPDVVLGFQEGAFVTLKLYSLGLGVPMVCAIRESPFRYSQLKASPPFWFSCQVFRLASAVTVQFSRYAEAFPSFLQSKIKVTPNHVLPATVMARPADDVHPKILLSTGRISPEKNHATLVDAFGLIADKFPDWQLVIVGRGGEVGNIADKIATYPDGVRERMILAGVSDDVPSWLARAHVFCLPSWWEGFPNALAEAMAHGLPAVGFRECDGVSDLIDDGVTGYLADGGRDARLLADKLSVLMADPVLRGAMGRAASDKVAQFAPRAIFDMWENLLRDVASR